MSTMPPSSTPGGSYTPPPPPSGTPAAGGDRQLMLVLSYVLFLGVIPLVSRGEDREVRWHAINGLALFGAYAVVSVLWAVLNLFVSLPCASSIICGAIFLGYIAVAVLGIMKALKGERLRIPVLSDLADK